MNNITIIISTNREDDHQRRDLEKWLVDRLSEKAGVDLLIVPHLIDLQDDGPSVKAIAEISGNILLLSWMFPRPAFWTLRADGIDGRIGESFDAGSERTICCIQLDCGGHEAVLDKINRLTETIEGQGGEVRRVEEEAKRRWYPVIDYDRCTNCLECLNFCLFGVFDLDESDQIVAQQPDACRDGCPACSRVCPSSAIMFPRHRDETIAGSDKPSDAIRGLDILGSMACECKLPKPKSDVDDLIDKLDELEL